MLEREINGVKAKIPTRMVITPDTVSAYKGDNIDDLIFSCPIDEVGIYQLLLFFAYSTQYNTMYLEIDRKHYECISLDFFKCSATPMRETPTWGS